MADGPNIASAYVQLIPTMEGAQEKIGEELGRAGEGAGKSAGAKIGSAIKGAIIAAGIGAAIKTAVDAGKQAWESIKTVAEYGDAVDKAAQKVGMSTDAYQKWDYALKLSGSSMDQTAMGVKTLTNTLEDARAGTQSARDKFAALGISMDDLKDKSRDDVFGMVVTQLQGVTDETQRAALATEMFGRSGMNMIPMLNMSSEELQKVMDEADRYGIVMSEDSVKAAAAFDDAMLKMQSTAQGVRNRVFGAMMPAITKIMDGFSDSLAGFEGGSEKISEGINDLVSQITDKIPYALELLAGVIPEVIGGIATALTGLDWESISQSLLTAVTGLAEAAVQAAPQLAGVAMTLLTGLITGLATAAPTMLPQVTEAILGTITALFDHAPELLQAATALLLGLVDGILASVEVLLGPSGQATLQSIIDAITAAIPMLLTAAVELLVGLLNYLIDNADTLIPAATELVITLVTGIGSMMGELFSVAIDLLLQFLAGLNDPKTVGRILKAGVDIVLALVRSIGAQVSALWSAGMDIVRGIWQGISNGYQWIKNMISGWVGNVVSFIKNLFGIGSPSKVMASQVGQWLPAGLAEGIIDNKDVIGDAWDEVAGDLDTGASVNVLASASRIGTNVAQSAAEQTARIMTPEQFALAVVRALKDVKVELDGREAGRFVERTVLNAVYY